MEFSDYQCQPCAQYFTDTYPEIDLEYIQTGKARYVFKNFPMETVHPEAFKAHEAAACAGDQGKFWEMNDLLFTNHDALAPKQLVTYAKELGLDSELFSKCLESDKHAAMIRSDIEEGIRGGVRGTPVFAIGFTEPGASSLKVVRVLAGVQPYDLFKEAIEAVLARAK